MNNLITRERAQQSLGAYTAASFTNEENRILDHLIAAISSAIRRFCHRDFTAQSYDELHDGCPGSQLLLNHYPIIAVERVACNPVKVLEIQNNSSANQRATVQVTKDGLTLISVASGVQSVDTSITWSSYATLASVADAVTALGSGWLARVPDSTFALWASQDLRPIQGALACKDRPIAIKLHVDELAACQIDEARGWLHLDDPGQGESCCEDSSQFWRVIYTAGYNTVPEDVQEACAQWVAILFYRTKHDPALSNSVADSSGGAYFSLVTDKKPPGAVRSLLLPYRTHRLFVDR